MPTFQGPAADADEVKHPRFTRPGARECFYDDPRRSIQRSGCSQLGWRRMVAQLDGPAVRRGRVGPAVKSPTDRAAAHKVSWTTPVPCVSG